MKSNTLYKSRREVRVYLRCEVYCIFLTCDSRGVSDHWRGGRWDAASGPLLGLRLVERLYALHGGPLLVVVGTARYEKAVACAVPCKIRMKSVHIIDQ